MTLNLEGTRHKAHRRIASNDAWINHYKLTWESSEFERYLNNLCNDFEIQNQCKAHRMIGYLFVICHIPARFTYVDHAQFTI